MGFSHRVAWVLLLAVAAFAIAVRGGIAPGPQKLRTELLVNSHAPIPITLAKVGDPADRLSNPTNRSRVDIARPEILSDVLLVHSDGEDKTAIAQRASLGLEEDLLQRPPPVPGTAL